MDQAIIIENIEKLKQKIAATGVGQRFDQQIDDNFAKGLSSFKLSTSEIIEGHKLDLELDINSKEGKGYFNGTKITFHNQDGTTVEQWFKANDRITVNEAYILLLDQHQPRALHKTYYDETGEKYGQWIQLDFTKKTDRGNHLTKRFGDFDQVQKLNDFDFVELGSSTQKITAAAYMAEGREIMVTPINQEKYAMVILRTNPERKTHHILDTEGNYLSHEQFRTAEAKTRVQQEKNSRESSVTLVKDNETSKRSRIIGEDDKTKGKSL